MFLSPHLLIKTILWIHAFYLLIWRTGKASLSGSPETFSSIFLGYISTPHTSVTLRIPPQGLPENDELGIIFFANATASCFLDPVFEECILLTSFVAHWHFKLLLISCPLTSAGNIVKWKVHCERSSFWYIRGTWRSNFLKIGWC